MRVVHRLEFDAFLGALKVCICDELLDSCKEYDVVGPDEESEIPLVTVRAEDKKDGLFTVDETLESGGFLQMSLEHDGGVAFWRLGKGMSQRLV